jgi:hypothetical protein
MEVIDDPAIAIMKPLCDAAYTMVAFTEVIEGELFEGQLSPHQFFKNLHVISTLRCQRWNLLSFFCNGLFVSCTTCTTGAGACAGYGS